MDLSRQLPPAGLPAPATQRLGKPSLPIGHSLPDSSYSARFSAADTERYLGLGLSLMGVSGGRKHQQGRVSPAALPPESHHTPMLGRNGYQADLNKKGLPEGRPRPAPCEPTAYVKTRSRTATTATRGICVVFPYNTGSRSLEGVLVEATNR